MIDRLRNAIVRRLREQIPGVSAEVHPRSAFGPEDLNEALKNRALALRVAFLGCPDGVEWSSNDVDATTSWCVYVVTKDTADKRRDVLALEAIPQVLHAVAQGLFVMPAPTAHVPGDDEDDCDEREQLHKPKRIRVDPLYEGEIDTKSAMVWSVGWTQKLSIPPSDCSDLRDFLTLTTHYDLAPGDGTNEATDTIRMRQP